MNKSLEVVLALILGLISGFAVGKNGVLAPMGISDQSAQSARIQKLQSQIEQAKKFFPPAPTDVRSISGTVAAVQGATLVLGVSGNPLDEGPQTRNVTVGSNTKVTRSEQKDAALFGQELAIFQKAVRAQGNSSFSKPLTPPTPFREAPGKLTDIQPGQQVTITAGENIRDKVSFTAVAVSIYVPPK